jgi:putative hydrolase of the HAD superfamily
VLPVLELGTRAVHIPYHVTWHHEHVPEESMPTSGWDRLNSISELEPLLSRLDKS